MKLDFDAEGHLLLVIEDPARRDLREPLCIICDQPIQWQLDMFSFSGRLPDGREGLGHARCLWIPLAFRNEAKKAKKAPRRRNHDRSEVAD